MQPICQKWMPRENNFEFPTFFSLILFPRAVKTIKVMIDSYLKRDIRVCFVKLDEANKVRISFYPFAFSVDTYRIVSFPL
mmetsp:Transcript_17797/g.22627  ORF Transcript_17797/g.22627 Transcript_17797/m.22627 type:complete len:80 (+) Transcript_17797:1852-2091(+)